VADTARQAAEAQEGARQCRSRSSRTAQSKRSRPRPAGLARTGRRSSALALEVATAGLARHPNVGQLAQLRQQALYRLMERHQLQDPFRFLIYAEMAGVEIGPVA
jgi:hypothetical protein